MISKSVIRLEGREKISARHGSSFPIEHIRAGFEPLPACGID
jgi:hypothetical protein